MKTYPLARQYQIPSQHRQLNRPQQQEQHQPPTSLQRQQKVSETETDVALVVGRASWWIPLPTGNGSNNKNSASNALQNLTFSEALKDFLRHVSFHCYGKLVETGRRFQEKLFWVVFHVAALATLIIFFLNYYGSGDRQMATSIYDPLYPIRKVPFPAVSVCTSNRISNTSATRYAEELNNKDPRKRGVSYFYERIKLLNYNYYSRQEITNYEQTLDFQRFLDYYDRKENERFFNTKRRMAMLTPNCSDILLQCRLAGKDFDCARDFSETFTSHGLCCTFNHDHKYSNPRKFQHRLFGDSMGLILLLNATHNDDLFDSSEFDGFTINIHSPNIYPDPSSGSVEEHFVTNGTDTFLSITSKILQTVDEVRYLSPKVRNCLYHDEMPSTFGDSYTFSNCISHCRFRSILVLCGCQVFYAALDSLSLNNDTEYCTLQHRDCLMRYDFKWFNVLTQRQNVRGLEREMEDALYCPNCLPTCTETKYTGAVMTLPLNEYNMKSFKSNGQNFTDLAIIRIYFGETHAIYYKSFLVNSWFEDFSFVGNICGIIAGFSLVGICEVIFFFIKQIYAAFRNESATDSNKHVKRKSKEALLILP